MKLLYNFKLYPKITSRKEVKMKIICPGVNEEFKYLPSIFKLLSSKD